MSKAKNNNNKGNKGGKVPVKTQTMKPQAPIVKKNVKEIKPSQIVNKTAMNKVSKVEIKKPVDKKNNQPKKLEKSKVVTDILESCDDEDESDIDFEEMDDSDIDDVDINDSDDMEEDDEEDDDDEDLSVEDFDNSDYESVELDDEKLNVEGQDSSEESEDDEEETVNLPKKKTKVQEVKKVEVKKVEPKETKKQEPVVNKKPEIKETKKVETTKVGDKETKKVENKIVKVNVEPDNTTEDGRLLIEINNRKNNLCDSTVFVSKITNLTRESLGELINTVAPVVQINLPASIKKKAFVLRGYGFIRMINPVDAEKCIEVLNNNNMKASKFVCKKVINDITKVCRNKVMAHSFKNEDITDILSKEFKAPIKVQKNLINQYVLEFPTNEAALAVFNKKSMTVGGHKLMFNFYVGKLKEFETNNENKVAPIVKTNEKAVAKKDDKVVKQVKAEVAPVKGGDKKESDIKVVQPVKVEFEAAPVVKAGVKRAMVSSEEEDDDEECEVVVKKFKQVNGDEKKVTPKKVSSPEVKKLTPKSENKVNKTKLPVKKENEKKPFEKSPGEKKHFNKSPGEKKHFNKSPGEKKQFNKSPGDKKQFNKGNKSPAGNKQQFKNKSPGNRKSFNKKF